MTLCFTTANCSMGSPSTHSTLQQRVIRHACVLCGACGSHHRGLNDQYRRPIVLLQLRLVRGRVRSWLCHFVSLVQQRHCQQHDLGHQHGDTTRRWRDGDNTVGACVGISFQLAGYPLVCAVAATTCRLRHVPRCVHCVPVLKLLHLPTLLLLMP